MLPKLPDGKVKMLDAPTLTVNVSDVTASIPRVAPDAGSPGLG